jgi:hypothetical protein
MQVGYYCYIKHNIIIYILQYVSCDQLSVENVSHRRGGGSLILKKHVHYVAYETDLHFFTVTVVSNITSHPPPPA